MKNIISMNDTFSESEELKKDVNAIFFLGHFFMMKNDHDSAIKAYTAALEKEEDSTSLKEEIRCHRANAYLKKGMYDEAISDCAETMHNFGSMAMIFEDARKLRDEALQKRQAVNKKC